MNSDRDLVPVWTNYRGRSSVCCKGKLVSARCDCNGIGVLCFTVAIITFPSISFLSFDCIILAERLSVVVPIVAVTFIIFTLSTLLRAALMDPGIIPRATPYEAWWIENCITEAPADTPGTMRPPPRTRDVMVMGQSMKLKYCNTCKLFRPPRASHCSMCDNCIDRFDHHCPWVGNCVGRRNYRHFYLFLLSVFAYSCYVFSMSVLTMILLIQEKKDFVDAWKRSPFSVIEALIAFFSILSIIGLGGFHTYLIGNEVSTNEDIKGVFKKSLDPKIVNPFHRGNFLANFAYILCGPTPTSLLLMKEPAYNPSQMEQIRQAFHVKPQMTSNDALTMVSVDRQNDNVSNSDSSSLQVPILSPTKTHKDPIHDNVTYGSISHSILPME